MSNSIQVNDKNLIEKIICNPDFPYLISFPRTGSHWLRMIMELYFEKPSLVRIFYFKDSKDFTCYHRHDEDLTLEHDNVIYLYRNPVDTIYSQLNYYCEDINDNERIEYWAKFYGRHLSKWLIDEKFTKKKTIISYEGMKSNLDNEFKKICLHYDAVLTHEKLHSVALMITKEEVKRKTVHDKKVVSRSNDYEKRRIEFKENNKDIILELLLSINTKLTDFLII